MMWMLITVMCMSTGPDARCEKHVRPAVPERGECLALIKPLTEYLTATASETGAKLIFLSARCEPGRDG